MTLSDVGKSINKSKATISKYESNQIIPDAITLLELCNCLNISINDFLPITEEKNINSNNFKTFIFQYIQYIHFDRIQRCTLKKCTSLYTIKIKHYSQLRY